MANNSCTKDSSGGLMGILYHFPVTYPNKKPGEVSVNVSKIFLWGGGAGGVEGAP